VICLFLIENDPWVWLWDMGPGTNLGRFGEWAWVGRVYR
jgi:hypothetical protein